MSVKKIGKAVFLEFFWIVDGVEEEYYLENKKEVLEKNRDPKIAYENSKHRPVRVFKDNKNLYWLYKDIIYKFDRTDYSDHQMILQIMALEDRERRQFERLTHRFSKAEETEKEGRREPIQEEVRIAVWRRDEGKCVKCGSREKLEYDHIIPVSKGGSNTERNIQLLCEKCNREKRDNI
jgi:hypothetical protein